MKKIIAVVLLIIIMFSFVSCTTIANIVNPDYKDDYNDLLDMLLFLDVEDGYNPLTKRPNHLSKIKSILDEFPPFYKDIADIKQEYDQLEPLFKSLFDITSSYSERHKTAMHLLEIDSKYPKWDLARAIFHYMSDESILQVVLLGRWEDSSGNFLGFSEIEESDIWFSTNLLTDKQSDQEYYYYTANRAIGYYLKNDESSKFLSFRIVDISHSTINVYCYKDNTYYKLHNATKLTDNISSNNYADITYFILNTETLKYHLPTCSYLPYEYNSKRITAIYSYYSPCEHCNP